MMRKKHPQRHRNKMKKVKKTAFPPILLDYSYEDIDKDFNNVIPLLKKSIYFIENS